MLASDEELDFSNITTDVPKKQSAVTLSSKSHLRHLMVHLGISITEDEDLGGCGGALVETQVRVHAASVTVAAALAAGATATVSTTQDIFLFPLAIKEEEICILLDLIQLTGIDFYALVVYV
ncbi:hypothetical protein WN943_021144 [Citrus x changshan-huyou]